MIILKWFLIIIVGLDFIFDFVAKVKNNRQDIPSWFGKIVGLIARAYIIYILITVWHV